MPFRFLEHTADARAECRGGTFEGLLEAAAQALYAIALREARADCDTSRTIKVDGESREEVLVRWLQELIFLLEVERFVATGFAFAEADELSITAEARGYTCRPEERGEEVKSATYHGLDVQETPEGFIARVIFDL